MVHKKSTYRLTFKNYGKEIRRRVWHENNSIRERRREEEMSHHSIDENDSDCECDESEEEDESYSTLKPHRAFTHTQPKRILINSDEQIHRPSTAPDRPTPPPPHIPKLQFSPEVSPRTSQRQGSTNGTSDQQHRSDQRMEQLGDSNLDLNVMRDSEEIQAAATQARGVGGGRGGGVGVGGEGGGGRRAEFPREQIGVMRPGSHAKEYDLIPAIPEDPTILQTHTTSSKPRVLYKSHKLPFTSQLTRTTRHNYNQRDRVQYVPCGTGAPVTNIGDRTSYNVHLHKDQVHPTALKASTMRNREIEQLISRQKRMTLSDWRERQERRYDNINHSSIFGLEEEKDIGGLKGRRRRSAMERRRDFGERLKSAPSRVESVSNYCKHCGGRK